MINGRSVRILGGERVDGMRRVEGGRSVLLEFQLQIPIEF
jgi:hypothetical protein